MENDHPSNFWAEIMLIIDTVCNEFDNQLLKIFNHYNFLADEAPLLSNLIMTRYLAESILLNILLKMDTIESEERPTYWMAFYFRIQNVGLNMLVQVFK